MEAFAAGRPVLSTAIAGIPELVCPGENGWLVPPGDAGELAAAMRTILRTPAARLTALGCAGRDKVLRLHHSTTETDRLEHLLRDSISRSQTDASHVRNRRPY